MAPVDTKLSGSLSNAKHHFLPVRVKQNNRWVTKCIYPGCSKRKFGRGELQPERLESTSTQLYVHAMRFHKSGSRSEKLTKAEMEDELRAGGQNNNIGVADNPEKSENESARASAATIISKPPQALKALNDWKVLL